MPKLSVSRDPYKEGIHAGAAKSLKLTIGSLQNYLITGDLSRAGADKGLRKQQNDLLHRALQIAAQRGAHEERQRMVGVLNAMPAPKLAAGGFDAEENETVVPFRFKRAR